MKIGEYESGIGMLIYGKIEKILKCMFQVIGWLMFFPFKMSHNTVPGPKYTRTFIKCNNELNFDFVGNGDK